MVKLAYVLAVLMAVATGAQVRQEPEAYPGQREHAKPPDGWFCAVPSQAKDRAHACQCKRMAQPTAEDKCCEKTKPEEIREDTKCKVYCHKDHCTCPVQCGDGKEHVHQ